MSVMMQARCRMQCNRQPGGDELCPEMLKALPWSVVAKLRDVFQTRIIEPWSSATPPSWSSILGHSIPKDPGAHKLSQWRVISVSSFMQKWYTSVLTLLMERSSLPLVSQTLGFTAGRQTLEVTEVMRLLLLRAHE